MHLVRTRASSLAAQWGALALCLGLLFAAQALHTHAFLAKIGLEDAAESLRSPYWLAKGQTIYNGVASNVAYYFTIAAAQKIFGFSLYMAKWVRLGLHFFSLLALAILFRRWFGPKRALIPLMVVGLSPTWLFLNANQAQLGADLQLMPILLLLALLMPLRRSPLAAAAAVALGAGFLWAALVYPVSLTYFPCFALLLAWRWRCEHPRLEWLKAIHLPLAVLAGACVPVVGFLLYLKEPRIWVYDSVHKAGVFRGGGGGLTFDPFVVAKNTLVVLNDLFVRANSYIFEIPYVEFHGWLGRFAFLVAFGALFLLPFALKRKASLASEAGRDRAIYLWLAFSLAFLFLFPQLVRLAPGMRRTTGALFAYYGWVVFLWHIVCHWPRERLPGAARALLTLGIVAHLFSHAVTIGKNVADGRGNAGKTNLLWFNLQATPEESLAYLDASTRNGQPLYCGEKFNFSHCRYAEIYATIQSYRRWSGLPELPILGWDPKRKEPRVVDISLWESYEWPQ
jgi:hypothetical protein